MGSKVDLHLHTNNSDGIDSIEEIFWKAYHARLELIAITDHDSISAVKRTLVESDRWGVKAIAGVELSVYHQTKAFDAEFEVHLLSYGFNPENKKLLNTLEKNRLHRQKRLYQITEKLNVLLQAEEKNSINLGDLAHLEKQKGKIALSRVHLGELMVEKNIVDDVGEAFRKYLNVCNLPKRKLFLEEAAEIVREAGGKTVLAHPGSLHPFSLRRITNTFSGHRLLLKEMQPHLDGLECYYWDHDLETTAFYIKQARNMNLMITGGSDHHGITKGKERIGQLFVPDYVANYFK